MPVRADGGIAAQFCRNELSDLLNIVSDNPSVTFGDSSLYTREPHVYKQNTCTFFVQVRSLTNPRERFGEGDNSLSIFNRFWRHVLKNRAFSQSVATENASPFRSPPGNPAGFQAIGLPIKKRTFLMAWSMGLLHNSPMIALYECCVVHSFIIR